MKKLLVPCIMHAINSLYFTDTVRTVRSVCVCLVRLTIQMVCISAGLQFTNFYHPCVADPRTNDWFLIKSPMPGLSIMATYLYFVLSWGPRYMQHRKPYNLTNLLIVYNMAQVVISIFLFYEVCSTFCHKIAHLRLRSRCHGVFIT